MMCIKNLFKTCCER